MFDRPVEIVDPSIVQKVSAEKWFELLGGNSGISPWTFGYTDTPCYTGQDARTLPEHVFYFVTEGASEMVFGNKGVAVTRGSMIWIMPGVTHFTRRLAGADAFRNYYARLKITSSEKEIFRISDDYVLREEAWPCLPYFKQLVDELDTAHPFKAVRVRAVLQLLTSWAMAPATQPAQRERTLTAQQRVRLLRHMENSTGGVTPESLAKLLDLSPTYFSRVFRNTFGVAPKVWIVQQRIHVATTLLASTHKSLKEVATRLGYSDFFLFSRQFKQVMGVSPRAYRDGIVR